MPQQQDRLQSSQLSLTLFLTMLLVSLACVSRTGLRRAERQPLRAGALLVRGCGVRAGARVGRHRRNHELHEHEQPVSHARSRCFAQCELSQKPQIILTMFLTFFFRIARQESRAGRPHCEAVHQNQSFSWQWSCDVLLEGEWRHRVPRETRVSSTHSEFF